MVKKLTFEEILIDNVAIKDRCPHLRIDDEGPFCGNVKEDQNDSRRLVCDLYSLQLWCLDKSRCLGCIEYNSQV